MPASTPAAVIARRSVSDRFRLRVTLVMTRQNLSQRELARLAGIDQTTLSTCLRGENGLTVRTMHKLAGALGLPYAALTAPVRCHGCLDLPPSGFQCLTCGAKTTTVPEVLPPAPEGEPQCHPEPCGTVAAEHRKHNGGARRETRTAAPGRQRRTRFRPPLLWLDSPEGRAAIAKARRDGDPS